MFVVFLPLTSSYQEVECRDYNLSSCSFSCYATNSYDKVYCYTLFEAGLCREGRPWHLIAIGIVFVPALLGIVLRLIINSGIKPPIWSYLQDLLTNFMYVTFVNGIYCLTLTNDTSAVNFIFIFLPFMTIPILFSSCICTECTCCCIDEEKFPHYIKKKMFKNIYSRHEGESIITEARQNPPTVTILGNQHIYHRSGKHSWVEVSPVDREPVPYVSWEERGSEISIPDYQTIHVKMMLDVVETSELKAIHGEKKSGIESKMHQFKEWSVNDVYYVDKFDESIMMNIAPESPCCVGFFGSCFGHFIYILGIILGFHSLIETIWCSCVGGIKLKLEKHISEDSRYRASSNGKDEKAQTFCYKGSYLTV